MKDKSKTLGWNPTYFGEPKKGSLAAVIADVTEKQNAVVGEKPEVQSSAAVQAKEAQSKQEAMNPAQQAAIAIDMKKKGKKPKNEDDAADMRDKNKKDAKGEKNEDLNAEIEKAKAGKIKSLVDTIKDMLYNIPEAKHHDKDKEKEEDKLDPVNKDAVKKKFADRKDKDIDNDGDVDSTDKYLHKRRKAISKAVAK